MSKRQNISINPNTVKSRDLVHLQEITHGSGCGAHKGKRDMLARMHRKEKQRGYTD